MNGHLWALDNQRDLRLTWGTERAWERFVVQTDDCWLTAVLQGWIEINLRTSLLAIWSWAVKINSVPTSSPGGG